MPVAECDACAISDDTATLAVVRLDALTVLRREDAWQVVAVAPGRLGGTGDRLCWSPDGELLAYAAGGKATIYDRQLQLQHEELHRYISSVDFAPAGDLIAIGDWSSGGVISWPPEPSVSA